VAGEDIAVHEMPLLGADKWLAAKAQAGLLVDPKIYAGLYFCRQVAANVGRVDGH
jgi:ADP-ribose pyrophosphatase